MKKYENYVAALEVLRRAPEQDLSNEFVQSGVIDKFTVQFELGCSSACSRTRGKPLPRRVPRATS